MSAAATALALGGLLSNSAFAQQQNAEKRPAPAGPVVEHKATPEELRATSLQDISDARAMPMPKPAAPPSGPFDGGLSTKSLGKAGVSAGKRGTGKVSEVMIPAQNPALEPGDDIELQEFGTNNHPYTTARVDTVSNTTSKAYPFSAAGQLYFKDGTTQYVCSASLIKRGVIVTAAHCVSSFGQKRFYTNFQFIPARYNTTAPFGIWNGATAYVPTSYFNGTDSCAQKGVICQNDVAVIRLVPQANKFPGTSTGWLGYGYGGYGFTPNNLALVNQLGYPVSHDKGMIMQRTDSQGFVSGTLSGNTIWGSRQTGGSSGGPEVVNLGIAGSLTTPLGSEAVANIVVGVTSWGYVSSAYKDQGASAFTTANIVPLVTAACASANPACQ